MTDRADAGDSAATDDHALDVPIRGVDVDPDTRCRHYRTERDIVAIALPCCETFYPCIECHQALADHEVNRWPPTRFDEPAVLCGKCGAQLSVATYLDCDHRCPQCGGAFNPGCRRHWDRYFAVE